jgi:hypothetical protein
MPPIQNHHNTLKKRAAIGIRPAWMLAGAAVAVLLGGCGKEEPTYYEVQDVQPEPAAAHVQAEGDGHVHGEAAANPLGFTFALPEGWSQKVPTPMVIAAFQAGSPPELVADMAVSAFPGDVGGQVANIDRWRRQIGLGPIDPATVDGFVTKLQVSGIESWQVDMTGPVGAAADGSAPRMVVTAVARNGQTWFFKMVGPEAAVKAQLENYASFLNSIRF